MDGLPEHVDTPAAEPLDGVRRIAPAETFFAALGADIRHGGGHAYYAIERDYVQVPPFECFNHPEAY